MKVKTSFRRCVVCRRSDVKTSLFRVVGRNGYITLDLGANEPGRGAYVHRRIDCLAKVGDRGIWERALRMRKDSLDSQSVKNLAVKAHELVLNQV